MMKLRKLIYTAIPIFAFFAVPLAASAAISCSVVGMALGVSMACSGSCNTASQVDVSTFSPIIPASYKSQLSTLCTNQSCCADKGDTLCARAAQEVGAVGFCKPSCDPGEKLNTDAWSGTDNLCLSGSCCIAGSIGSPTPLSLPTGNPGQAASPTLGGNSVSKAAASTPVGYGLINPLGGRTIPNIMGSIINWASGLAGSIFFLYLLWGGFQWMTSGGDEEGAKKARQRIVAAVFGILIILFAYLAIDTLMKLANYTG